MNRGLRIDDLWALTTPSQPALSPDGSRVAYVLSAVDRDADEPVSSLWTTDASAGTRRLTRGTSDTAPAFSPDGRTLAFLRGGQLWTLPLDGGEPEQRTNLPLGAGPAVWSPDGGAIAFASPVDLEADDGEDEAARRKRANAPIVADGVGYQSDGSGFLRRVRRQVHVLDVASGQVRQLTSAAVHASSPSWSPDGSRLAFVAKPDGVDDLAFRQAVQVLDPADPAARPEVVAFADGMATSVAWAPTGDRFVVVGWRGDPIGIARLWSVDAATGAATELAARLDRNVMLGAPGYPGAIPQLSASGDVIFAARDRGCTHLFAVPLTGGDVRPVHDGAGNVVSGMSVAGDAVVLTRATPTSFGEVVRLDLASGEERVLTAPGSGPDGVELVVRESRRFAISDGVTVEGWLLRDPEASGPTPLLVDVHGGPHNAWNGAADATHLYQQELVARGWTVLLLNPRGSDGYGDAFFTAVNGAWGEVDAQDFLEPVDRLVADGIADPERLALTGYSYGGFMTCFLTGRDDRFKAAVAGGVVSDLTSMGGTSDEAHLLNALEIGRFPWRPEDRERLTAMSPYSRVHQVTTPTLVLQGGADVRCPVGQAEQWHYALRERGIPTRLVLYPGGGHLFPFTGRPSHRRDYNQRVVDWVERYAGGATGPRPAALDVAHWQRRLDALTKLHRVPGAQLGIMRLPEGREPEVVTAASGTLNRGTGAPVTTDALFQLGSITKVWTASVIMRLVDEGRLSLDTTVREALPELTLPDPELNDGVTIRHLLTHTSGLDGDNFTDTGRGDDAVEKYVASLATAGTTHPLGATWSYCNAGYSILGRVIEVVTGMTWDAAMAELLYRPLGLTHTVTLPEDAILQAAAVGHVEAGGEQVVTPTFLLPRSVGPAGLIMARAEDVLALARLHLRGGVTDDGARLLTSDTVADMQAFQAEVPDKDALGDSWGLGWIRFDWNGERLYGHDGNTLGQSAFLRIHPGSGLTVTLLTNGGHAHDLYEDLYREIFAELAGIRMKSPVRVPDEPIAADIAPFVGTYERASMRLEVFPGDDGPRLRTTLLGPLADLMPDPVAEYDLVPLADRLWAVREPGTQTWVTVVFYTLPTGEEYVHFRVRATPKVSDHVARSGSDPGADREQSPSPV